ncbi:MAG: hypothetical protein ACYC8V_06725 [Caulobacteraceae bacterium]
MDEDLSARLDAIELIAAWALARARKPEELESDLETILLPALFRTPGNRFLHHADRLMGLAKALQDGVPESPG